jgi:hypothetical protein
MGEDDATKPRLSEGPGRASEAATAQDDCPYQRCETRQEPMGQSFLTGTSGSKGGKIGGLESRREHPGGDVRMALPLGVVPDVRPRGEDDRSGYEDG